MIRSTLLVLLALSTGVLMGVGLYQHAETEAHATRAAELEAPADSSPAIEAPDPVDEPIGFVAKVYGWWRAGALAPAAILLAWGVAVFASRKWKRLQEGRTAFYFAAGLAALATLAEPASRGTTPSLAMVVAALASALVLAMKPQPQVKPSGLKSVP